MIIIVIIIIIVQKQCIVCNLDILKIFCKIIHHKYSYVLEQKCR